MQAYQFGVRDVMIAVVLVSVPLGMIVNESPKTGLAALFCAASICVIMTLISISAKDLFVKIKFAFEHRTIRPLIGRIRWLILDTIILTWSFAVISTANYVFANSFGRASWLVILGALFGPFTVWYFYTVKKARFDSGAAS